MGRWARVSPDGLITPGRLGEVVVEIRGGTERFYALDVDKGSISPGTEVVIVEYLPPRTVLVSRADG